MRLFVSLLLLIIVHTSLTAQTWEKRELRGVTYEFPTPNQQIKTSEAFGVSYDGDNIFLTVTSIPDTTEFKPETQLARSRYYKATAASVMFKLRGKMVAAKDTMIDDTHLFYSAIEILMADSAVSKYELLQYLQADTLHGFSCQYIVTDEAGIEMRDHFYNSISFSEKSGLSLLIALVIGGVVFGLIVLFIIMKRQPAAKS